MSQMRVLIMGYILGLFRDNEKENGNYYIIIGYVLGLYETCIPQKESVLVSRADII